MENFDIETFSRKLVIVVKHKHMKENVLNERTS